jgi:hypothetical protein
MARISVDRGNFKPQDYASDGTDAIGFIQFWGNSPALDLVHGDPQARSYGPLAIGTSASGVYKETKDSCVDHAAGKKGEDGGRDDGDAEDVGPVLEEEEEFVEDTDDDADPEPAPLPDSEEAVNVLIVGAADIRHVLKTAAKRACSSAPGRKLRFFLHDSRHETLARHILFLQVINNTSVPPRERMETFLSLYGNSLVRERDCAYVEEIAKEILELLTDDSSHPLAGLVDLEHMKYKDRDILQDVVKGWLKGVQFDAEALRDQRCRGYYRDRYDSRKNCMDWDYQTHLKEKCGVINWFHYKEFCFTGIAYETRLASYNTPNRTLASYMEMTDRAKGTTVEARGFWGDIINTPYHAFSTSCNAADRPRMFKISGSQYRHSETDVAAFNVTGFITEMDTGEPYHLPPETPEEGQFPYESPVERMMKAVVVDEVDEQEHAMPVGGIRQGGSKGGYGGAASDNAMASTSRSRRGRKQKVDWPALSTGMEGIEVVLLSGPLLETLKKPKYSGFFQRAFVGALAVMPLIEEMQLNNGGDAPFKKNATGKVRKLPRIEAPEVFGTRREESVFAGAMATGAEVVCETLKYQAHFDSIARLSFRHRLAQVGHLSGWRLADERHSCPRLETDMKERRACDLEKDGTDFMRFVTTAP